MALGDPRLGRIPGRLTRNLPRRRFTRPHVHRSPAAHRRVTALTRPSLLARAVGWKLTDTMMISFHRVERMVVALLEPAVQSTDAATAFGALMRTYRQRRLFSSRAPTPTTRSGGMLQ